MTLEITFIYFLVVVVFAAFVWEKYPPEVVAISSSAILIATGIIETKEFLSVFSSSAPITIAMMFIISAALERTGVIQIISDLLKRVAKDSVLKAMFVMMVFAMVASAFMNNTPVVIVLTPAVISLSASLNIAPSKLLIPLSFASIFGGTLTLVGTSTNILMNTVAVEAGQAAVGMFEMTIPGLIFATVGMIYMLLLSKYLLPDRYSLSSLLNSQKKRQFIAELLITHDSTFVGKNPEELKLSTHTKLIDIIRNKNSLRSQLSKTLLKSGDRLIILTDAGELVGLKENGDIELKANEDDFEAVSADETLVLEASVNMKSKLVGKTLRELNLRKKFGVYILAVHRSEGDFHKNFDKIRLKFADTLLIEGPATRVKEMLAEGDIINLSEPQDKPIRRTKAPIAVLTIISVMALAALNVLPIAGLAVIGAVLVMLTKCVDPDEAFDAIDWKILFIIFGTLGLSLGLQKTGAANHLVELLVDSVSGVGPVWILLLIYSLTSLLTESVSNNAVAVLIGPLVIPLAIQLGYDPRPFIMAVIFAASASFATPIGYQTNTFVYGAGGYKFKDFVKIGLPLNIIFALLAALIIPLFFPFEPGQ